MLDNYKVNDKYLPLIKEQLFITFQEHNASLQENEASIKRQLTDLQNKIDRLEERYILEELAADLYNKYKDKFVKEIDDVATQMKQNKIEMSKIEDYIAFSLDACSNLSKMWGSGDYNQRQELQNILFEKGIMYNRQTDECRSIEDNEFVTAIAQLSKDLASFGWQVDRNPWQRVLLPDALQIDNLSCLAKESKHICKTCVLLHCLK